MTPISHEELEREEADKANPPPDPDQSLEEASESIPPVEELERQ